VKVKKAAIAFLTMVVVMSCMAGRALGVGGPPTFGYPLVSGTFAQAMTTGPDGNIWFSGANRFNDSFVIGKVTLEGDVTEYPLPVSSGRGSIVSGPDGNLWFVEQAANAIGRITTEGEVTSFPLPGSEGGPTAIAAGPDGNLWFTEDAADKVGRITPSGQITEFPLPPERHPNGIAAGPDDSLWFTERGASRRFTEREPNWIGRITTSGQITHFQIPGLWAELNSITAGSDGNLWFAEEAAPNIGRITPQGQITQFPVPTRWGTDLIVSGPEGKLWFASDFEIGAISTSGVISWPACLVRPCWTLPTALAFGPDGSLWVGASVARCGLCGGGSVIELQRIPSEVGRFALPPVRLAISPRAAPVRRGKTSLDLACGTDGGCRGLLRLGFFDYSGPGERRFRFLARSRYRLAPGEIKRIPLDLLRGLKYRYEYVLALAGHEGQIQAKRSIRLELERGAGRNR
jgi:virginiamycin B lyase